MKNTLNLLLVTSSLFLVSCGNIFPKAKIHLPKFQLQENLSEYHQRALEITDYKTVQFTYKEQKIIRYDCNGHVKSNKMEIVNLPIEKLTIDFDRKNEAWKLEAYNRTTRSGRTAPKIDSKINLNLDGGIVIHTSSNDFHMRVKTGSNDIEYTFWKCPEFTVDAQGRTSCPAPVTLKEGMMKVNVLTRTETLPGEIEIHPMQGECPAQL